MCVCIYWSFLCKACFHSSSYVYFYAHLKISNSDFAPPSLPPSFPASFPTSFPPSLCQTGDTPLHLAASNGHLDTIHLLLLHFDTRDEVNLVGNQRKHGLPLCVCSGANPPLDGGSTDRPPSGGYCRVRKTDLAGKRISDMEMTLDKICPVLPLGLEVNDRYHLRDHRRRLKWKKTELKSNYQRPPPLFFFFYIYVAGWWNSSVPSCKQRPWCVRPGPAGGRLWAQHLDGLIRSAKSFKMTHHVWLIHLAGP